MVPDGRSGTCARSELESRCSEDLGAGQDDGDAHNEHPVSRITLPASPQSFPNLRGNETTSRAAFGQLTIPVLDALRITGGVRYTEDEKSAFNQTSASGSITAYSGSWDSFTYKAGVEADVRAGSMLYANISTGFKAGGIDQGFNNYKPEKLKAYALGIKNRFLDDRLQLNSEAYCYDYTDFQAQYGYRCQNAAACSPVQTFSNTIVNAGAATLYGAEIETTFRLTPADLLDFSVAYTHSVFDELIIRSGTANNSPVGCAAALTCAVLANQVLTDEALANAPEWSGSKPLGDACSVSLVFPAIPARARDTTQTRLPQLHAALLDVSEHSADAERARAKQRHIRLLANERF